MALALDNELGQATQTAQEWATLTAGGSYEPGTYLLTTKWDQGTPYNNQTPIIGNKRTLTGCVATAMAQIMKHHKHPSGALTGIIPEYTTKTEKLAIPSVNLANITFDWENMEAEAVATLMSVVGKAVKMDYGTDASGASSENAASAFREYFNYDSRARYVEKDYFEIIEKGNWITMLKEQINSNLPVFYAGGITNAHAFVLDGYDNYDNFHFNWGWGGSYDGFFTLLNLNPGSNNYTSWQGAIIDIKPLYSVSVSFDLNGGSGTAPASINLLSGSRLGENQKPPTQGFTKSGYANDGKWYTDPAGTTEFVFGAKGTPVTSDITLYLRWTPTSTCTVTFNYDGNVDKLTSSAGFTLGYIYSILPSLTKLTKFGYTFNGWFTEATGGTQVTESTVCATNITIYAQWTPITYTITYNLNDGTVEPANPTSYTIETENFTLNNPTKTGYTFAGWTGTNGATPQTIVSISQGIVGDRSYTANWTSNITPILPNQANNAILLSNLPPSTKVEVYNLQGKCIYSAYTPENPRILRILVQTKGIYIVKANNQTMRVAVR